MTYMEFVRLAKEFWPTAVKLDKAPGMVGVWTQVVGPYSEAQVRQALQSLASDADRMPQPSAVAQAIRACGFVKRKREEDSPPSREYVCLSCETKVTEYQFEGNWYRLGGGGLVFKKDGNRWYAARCPNCQGPLDRRNPQLPTYLPIPAVQNWLAGEWAPRSQTPAERLFQASVAEYQAHGMFAMDMPATKTYVSRIRAAIEATQERMQGQLRLAAPKADYFAPRQVEDRAERIAP